MCRQSLHRECGDCTNITRIRLQVVAARCAFHAMSRITMSKIAEFLDIALPADADTFTAAWTLTKGVLQSSDEETLTIMEQRLASLIVRRVCAMNEFMKLDETAEVISKEDAEKIQKHKEALHVQDKTYQDFKDAYVVRAKRIRAPAAPAKGRGRGRQGRKGGGRGGGHPWGERQFPQNFPAGSMSQSELKTFLPPGAFCWMGVGSMTWQGHLRPFPRCSFKWAHAGGPNEAARSLLRHLWGDYLVSKGMEPSECPIPGLF